TDVRRSAGCRNCAAGADDRDMTPIFSAVLALLALQGGGPAARWTFDGDAKDSGPASLPTKVLGRLEFIDSPVSGKAAVFNGVDAFVQVEPPAKLGAGSGDFTLSAWVFPLDRRPAALVARNTWSLQQIDGGALKFGTVQSPPGAFPANRWNHVVVTVKRPEVTILVNGEAAGGGSISEDLDPPQAPLIVGKGFTGLMD